jgi:hypothetical protein
VGFFYFQQWLRLSLPFSRGHHSLAETDTLGNLEWSGLSWLGDFDKPRTGTVRELRAPLTLFPTRLPSIPSLGGLLLSYFLRQSAFSLARHLGQSYEPRLRHLVQSFISLGVSHRPSLRCVTSPLRLTSTYLNHQPRHGTIPFSEDTDKSTSKGVTGIGIQLLAKLGWMAAWVGIFLAIRGGFGSSGWGTRFAFSSEE